MNSGGTVSINGAGTESYVLCRSPEGQVVRIDRDLAQLHQLAIQLLNRIVEVEQAQRS